MEKEIRNKDGLAVKDVIEFLSTLDPNMPVEVFDDEYGDPYPCTSVQVDERSNITTVVFQL